MAHRCSPEGMSPNAVPNNTAAPTGARSPEKKSPMVYARIEQGLVKRVFLPALEAFVRATQSGPREEQQDAAYALVRMRSALKRGYTYIREPNSVRLANAARVARETEQVTRIAMSTADVHCLCFLLASEASGRELEEIAGSRDLRADAAHLLRQVLPQLRLLQPEHGASGGWEPKSL